MAEVGISSRSDGRERYTTAQTLGSYTSLIADVSALGSYGKRGFLGFMAIPLAQQEVQGWKQWKPSTTD